MRWILAVVAVLGLAVATTTLPAAAAAATTHGYVLVSQQGGSAPSGKLDVNIDVNKGHGGAWWTSPVWLAIGAIALVVLILILALIIRGGGGGTTIIRE